MDKHIFPLYFPGRQKASGSHKIIAVDLRKTKSKIAYYSCTDGKLTEQHRSEYGAENYASFSEMVQHFLSENSVHGIERMAVSVPGPVISGKCITPNLPWTLDEQRISAETKIPKVYLINDLEATAYSLSEFDKELLEIMHTSDEKLRGNVAILAPGNGLGEAGLFFDGKFLRPFATEGGHTEFSPRNDFEVQYYHFLNKIHGIVTWENVLSKTGIFDLYRFLRDVAKHPEDQELTEQMKNGEFYQVITKAAKAKKSRLASLTVELYAEFLAREANSLVLKLKAVGALIITGEIPNVIFDAVNKEKFYKDFMISDRMEHLLKDIPIYLIKNPESNLQGAAFYGAFIDDDE